MGRTRESPFCCDHPSSPDRHVEDCPTLQCCPLCGLGRDIDEPSERFAVWLNSRGWLVEVDGRDVVVAPRLRGATWFHTEDEAQVALEAVDRAEGGGADGLSEIGAVVSL